MGTRDDGVNRKGGAVAWPKKWTIVLILIITTAVWTLNRAGELTSSQQPPHTAPPAGAEQDAANVPVIQAVPVNVDVLQQTEKGELAVVINPQPWKELINPAVTQRHPLKPKLSTIEGVEMAWIEAGELFAAKDSADEWKQKEHAIVLLFHGCSHDARTWFTFPEEKRVVRTMLAHGYTTVAFSSKDRSSGCWDTHWPLSDEKLKPNEDITRVLTALRIWLEREKKESLPMIAFGASSGGVFVSILCRAMNLKAALIQISPGNELALTTISTFDQPINVGPPRLDPRTLSDVSSLYPVPPILFHYMSRDRNWASTQNIEPIVHLLASHNYLSKTVVSHPHPLTPTWCASRLDEWTNELQLSRAFFDTAVKLQFIDTNGYIKGNPRQTRMVDRILTDLLSNGNGYAQQSTSLRAMQAYLEEEMNMLYGEHEFTSEHIEHMITFFDAFSLNQHA